MDSLTSALSSGDDLPGTFPLHPTEIRIGYARASTGGQKLGRQIDALTLAGCRRVFLEKKSGKNDLRPELKACHAFLQSGDTLVVPSLDRYGRSLQDPVNMVGELRKRQIGFTSLHERLDTTTPGGRLIFHVFAALAEFIRELIVLGTNEGLAAARARGRVGDRSTVVNVNLPRAARDMLPNPENSIGTIATPLGVSVGTLYNHIPGLKELRTSRIPAQLEGKGSGQMTSAPYRMKGAALVLGARTAGEIGPFGPYGGKIKGDIDEQDQAHAEPDDSRTDHGHFRCRMPSDK
ncbi:recombinase family protein [Streptomyces beigongshangae]|uniref:recombinase family protein n=1 Tax=Streptomyces beigongshangae TaxID=2841597 RepID=UPI0027E0939B|nr:recombinase family protein [Streptomyces sp. REN17]